MKQKNTKELDDILGKTHISDFDKFCVEQKGSMDPEQNAFSEYIKDLLKEKKITQQMVFLKADIPEKYGYKLLSGEKHTRQRDIILRICYAAELATVYKGNIIKNLIMDCQSYTKYRPNETTGGIFVSWRRKEELPTGA